MTFNSSVHLSEEFKLIIHASAEKKISDETIVYNDDDFTTVTWGKLKEFVTSSSYNEKEGITWAKIKDYETPEEPIQ